MRPRDVTHALDRLLRDGAIRGWQDVCDGHRYVVTTNEGKLHTWNRAQIAAFHCGYCAALHRLSA